MLQNLGKNRKIEYFLVYVWVIDFITLMSQGRVLFIEAWTVTSGHINNSSLSHNF